jgi:hypothetical protein
MYFWYGQDQALILDKTKVSANDIKTELASKSPKPPFCHGRLALYDGDGGKELRVTVNGAKPSRLLKDLKLQAAEHSLRGIEVLIDEGGDDESEEVANRAADVATTNNRMVLAKAAQASPLDNMASAQPTALAPDAADRARGASSPAVQVWISRPPPNDQFSQAVSLKQTMTFSVSRPA